MGARGATASSEAADVVLLIDRLDRLVDALRIAHRVRRIAVQSVGAGMAMSILAMIVAAVGLLPPIAGAVLQEFIDVAVIVNALRALRGRASAASDRLSSTDAERLKAEHVQLGHVISQIQQVADALPQLPSASVAAVLTELNDSLAQVLMPHEQRDDAQVYPALERLLGGEDPMAAMSGMHREIFRIVRLLARMTENFPPEGADADGLREIQRLLYGLDAIVRLHCAQEDELFHALGDEGASPAGT
jgi:hemerythrin-like domain-containing protein